MRLSPNQLRIRKYVLARGYTHDKAHSSAYTQEFQTRSWGGVSRVHLYSGGNYQWGLIIPRAHLPVSIGNTFAEFVVLFLEVQEQMEGKELALSHGHIGGQLAS
jgi:hypothetical protein